MAAKYTFSKALKELRFHMCQTGQSSAAARAFLTSAYPELKKANPHTPILIREAAGVEPKVWARYEYGRERAEALDGLDNKGIAEKVQALATASQ